jgi:phosphoglycolate phosphatase
MTDRIDTVLFDFDGTLIDIKINFIKMKDDVLSLGREYGVSPDTDLYILESIDYMFNILQQKNESLANTFRQQVTQILVSIELDATSTARAFPGADETLRKLKNKGIKVGIVTRNCRLAVLKSSEMAGFEYDLLLTRDDVVKVKPDPQHLLDALNILGSKPDRAIMVGDHPMDILAGKRANMLTAAVLTMKSREDFDEVAPDLILNDVSGILEIL